MSPSVTIMAKRRQREGGKRERCEEEGENLSGLV
jgi:hypothetical protein